MSCCAGVVLGLDSAQLEISADFMGDGSRIADLYDKSSNLNSNAVVHHERPAVQRGFSIVLIPS